MAGDNPSDAERVREVQRVYSGEPLRPEPRRRLRRREPAETADAKPEAEDKAAPEAETREK